MSPGWQEARRILCVRLDSLGDVLMCTPAMRALRDAVPGRTLTLLGSPAGIAAAPFIPELDDAIAYEAPWMKASPRPQRAGGPGSAGLDGKPLQNGDLGMIDRLARDGFDAAVIFTTYTQSALPAALFCDLAGIPLRLAHCRENPYHLLTDWVPDTEADGVIRHEVARQLALVRQIGCRTGRLRLSFVPRQADLHAARECLARAGIDPGQPWLLLHPGASAASRRYPAGHWARAARLLGQRVGLPLVFTGSAAEIDLVEGIRAESGVPTCSLAGQLQLGELGAAIGLASVAITNNTGPAHIAAAVGTPVVDLYALTNPQHMPWNVRTRVLFKDVPCRFCLKSSCPVEHHACLAGVAPEEVAGAVEELLSPPPPRPGDQPGLPSQTTLADTG